MNKEVNKEVQTDVCIHTVVIKNGISTHYKVDVNGCYVVDEKEMVGVPGIVVYLESDKVKCIPVNTSLE